MSTLALCIPAFNASAFLPKLLISAKDQVVPFDEILVYNDCSTDDTSEVARSYGATVIEGDINRGCSSGKNVMASVAKSKWLHFHDADDDLLTNFTQVAHRWINQGNVADIILMHFLYKTFPEEQLISEPSYNVKELKEDPVKFSIINKLVNFALIKRDAFIRIGGFNTDPKVLYNEDRAFYTKATLSGLTLDYEPEPTCINYYHSSSMSASNKAKCAKASLQVWEDVINATGNKYNDEVAEQLLHNAAYAATADDWKTVRKSITMALAISPHSTPVGIKSFQYFFKFFPFISFYLREKLLRILR